MLFLNESTQVLDVDIEFSMDLKKLCEELGINIDKFDIFTEESAVFSGVSEILFHIEEGWNAVAMDMMKCEHRAIVNEDMSILKEADESFWKKIKEFFGKIWATVKGWASKVGSWFSSLFSKVKKWITREKKNIAGKTAEAETYKSIIDGDSMADAIKNFEQFTGGPNKELSDTLAKLGSMRGEEVKEAQKKVKKVAKEASVSSKTAIRKVLGEKEKGEVSADKLMKSLENDTAVLNTLKIKEKELDKNLKTVTALMAAASKGEDSSTEKQKAVITKNIITAQLAMVRDEISLIQSMSSASFSALKKIKAEN